MTTWMTRYIEAWDGLDEASVGAFHAEDGICDDVASDKGLQEPGRTPGPGAMDQAGVSRLPVQRSERATVRRLVRDRVGVGRDGHGWDRRRATDQQAVPSAGRLSRPARWQREDRDRPRVLPQAVARSGGTAAAHGLPVSADRLSPGPCYGRQRASGGPGPQPGHSRMDGASSGGVQADRKVVHPTSAESSNEYRVRVTPCSRSCDQMQDM